MEFELTEDQVMLRDMAERLATKQHDFEARRAAIASPEGWLPGFWAQLAELGLLAATLPEDADGLGGGGVEAMLIHRAFGRRLVISPCASTMVAANLVARAGTEAQKRDILPAVIAGECRIALALTGNVEATARDDGAILLSGQEPLVAGAPWCTHMLVAAHLPGDAKAVFLVAIDLPGLTARPFRTIDGGRAAGVAFDDAIAARDMRIGDRADLADAIALAGDEAALALCAEACGSIEALLDTTVTYARTRKQFGKPIGSFQVLQHRMVDMLVMREQAISITHQAALMLDAERVPRARAVSAAKAHVGRVGRQVAQAAVQIHGAIGTTEELDVSHHFRRIEMLDLQYGSIDAHVRRYADLLDEAPPPLRA